MTNQPLVSVIVATYNSSKYVCATLDSIIAQSYSNIEIIITDDCSTDNTVDVCRRWILDNSNKNENIRLLEAAKNTGVTGNANRGFNVSKGEWIKFIAGDDLLAPTAIEAYVKFVTGHPNVRHLRARAVHFVNELSKEDLARPDKISQYMYEESVTAEKQFSVITKTFFGSGPTYFVHADTMRSLGGFDERFYMQEDYPFFIKMIGHGYKMYYMDYVTVYKRIVPTSIQYDKTEDALFPKNKIRMICEWKYQYKMEVLNPLWRSFLRYSLWIQSLIIKLGNSKKSIICKFLYYIYRATDPFVWADRWLAHKNQEWLKQHYK